MPYINFDEKTFHVLSVSENKGDLSYIEISNETFEKIMNGELDVFHIRKHPRKNVFIFSETEFFDWFKWINHDCSVSKLGILVNKEVKRGDRFILTKRGNGNLIYKIVDAAEDAETFFIEYESPTLDELDVFMSAEN